MTAQTTIFPTSWQILPSQKDYELAPLIWSYRKGEHNPNDGFLGRPNLGRPRKILDARGWCLDYAIDSILKIGMTIMFILVSSTSTFGTFDTGCLRSTTFGRSNSGPPLWPLEQSVQDAFWCPDNVLDRCHLEGCDVMIISCRPLERSILDNSQRRLDWRRSLLLASRFNELILTWNKCKHVLVLQNKF